MLRACERERSELSCERSELCGCLYHERSESDLEGAKRPTRFFFGSTGFLYSSLDVKKAQVVRLGLKLNATS